MTVPQGPEYLVDFWVTEVGERNWYKKNHAIDEKIRNTFHGLWNQGRRGQLDHWQLTPKGSLALIILLDQFPRNMFRNDAMAFSSDRPALARAKIMIERQQDMEIQGPLRQFCYIPFMHSEDLDDQDECIRLMSRHVESESSLYHARMHREVIARFGRFPYRNSALGRENTPQEQAYLDSNGYRS